ncbi:uncharacterized protein [Spinacia oleracea]|uniref:RNase H type-1 domain-containing protein n=1 Tax=Spinacia oleracea TaxID=3562 RepID=A0A9R0IHL8_SPIOL|nr:uncharacterized protein LOC110789152 [Spinacia oleracea]
MDAAYPLRSQDWALVFVVTCWWLWQWRKMRCFSREVDIPVDQVAFIFARVGAMKNAMDDKMLGGLTDKKSKCELFVSLEWRASKSAVDWDTEVVVHMMVEEEPANSPYIHIIHKCKTLIARQGCEVTISHCYRKANRAADWLANFGVDSDQKLVFLEAVLRDLQTVLLEDLGGMTIPRLVPAVGSSG